MQDISHSRHQPSPQVIPDTLWLYASFALSLRNVEMMRAEHGIDGSYKIVRRWFPKFNSTITANHSLRASCHNLHYGKLVARAVHCEPIFVETSLLTGKQLSSSGKYLAVS